MVLHPRNGSRGTSTIMMKPDFIIITAIFCSSSCLASECSNVLAPAYTPPTVSSGWTAQLVVNGFTKPRTLAFDSSGALLVLDSGVGIKRITLTDNGGSCLIPDTPVVVVNATSVSPYYTRAGRRSLILTTQSSTMDSLYPILAILFMPPMPSQCLRGHTTHPQGQSPVATRLWFPAWPTTTKLPGHS